MTTSNSQSRIPAVDQPFDVLIIGGGIVGAGIARDASMRGLRTLLVEQADFASGTSSRSSRLLHGGLRYLAQAQVSLVRESSLEKVRLGQIVPHLCQPMPFVFPIWHGKKWSLWLLSLGVRVYDLLCSGKNFGRSGSMNASEVAKLIPGLNPRRLSGATRHFDAFTNDSRLVIDTLKSAAANGAVVRNYVKYTNSKRIDGGWSAVLTDQLFHREYVVTSSVIVNATGAWAQLLDQSTVQLRLTKGVHLVISAQRLEVPEAVILTDDRRILFVIPWGNKTILGTTDTDYKGDPATVQTDPADVQYILDIVNSSFPAAKLQANDVMATWAGIRPLVSRGKSKSGSPSDISRSHVIRMPHPGWFDVAGGKLTTHRHMAEEAVDQIGSFLKRKLPRCNTAYVAIDAGPFSGVLPPPVQEEVVAECCANEWAVNLDDILLRRTSWHYYHSDQEELPAKTAKWMAKQLSWSPEETASQLSEFYRRINFSRD